MLSALNKNISTHCLNEIDLCVTMKCNLNCSFCSVRANEHHNEELTTKQIFRLISEAKELGLKELHLTGGEPALRKDLEQIVHFASKMDIETRVITNGTLMSKSRLIQLKDSGLKNIMVSIDGLEKTHNVMRGSKEAWNKAINCVKDAIHLGYKTRISSVAYKNNLDEIPELIKLADNLGADIFSVFHGSPLGRGSDIMDKIIDPEEWNNFIQLLIQKTSLGEFGSHIQLIAEQAFIWTKDHHHKQNSMNGRGCGCTTLLSDYSYLFITGNGNLYQCVFFMHDGTPIGNIKETQLSDCLNKAKKLAIYKDFIKPSDECTECSWVADCQGGCRGYSYLYNGNWHLPDPRCKKGNNQEINSFYPLCPIAKLNIRTMHLDGSSENALK